MARNRYLITYSNGKRRHVNRQQRDSLLFAGSLKQTGPQSYLCTLEEIIIKQFSQLERIKPVLEEQDPRHFLPGTFVVQGKDGSRRREMLETVGAMVGRLSSKNQLQAP
jgi:hypothetical protein